MDIKKVKVTEVGPRDGFQSEKTVLKTEDNSSNSSYCCRFSKNRSFFICFSKGNSSISGC